MNLFASLIRAAALSLFAPAARTATAQGSAVDLQDFEGPAIVTLDSAAGTGTTPTLDLTIQDSADGSTGWANVPASALSSPFTQVGGVASTQTRSLDVPQVRRFVRAVVTIGGTTPSFNCGVLFHGLRKYQS